MANIVQIKPRPIIQDSWDFPAHMPLFLQRIYASRGVYEQDQLTYPLSGLLSWKRFKNINQAADLIINAILNQQTILIVGDFDSDGATSTAIAVSVIKAFGGQHIDYLVPNRFEFGYGLTPELVKVAALKKPDLIITVDNGISNLEGVLLAKQLGIQVLITDHHIPGEQLPEADSIVNPNQIDCDFPSKNIAGVGVIFYVMLAVRSKLKDQNYFNADRSAPNMAQFLDLVALGTVADVVSLDYNNRILVSQGLKRIRAGLACPGIQALMTVANRNAESLVASDLGFALGPRLNAAGRLDDMSVGIELLLNDDIESAQSKAHILDELNTKRRHLEKEMTIDAELHLEQLIQQENQIWPPALCVYQANWHQGVIGILASRIKEKTNRPVVVFALSDSTKGLLKGSARSIPGFHIRDAFATIAVRYPNLLLSYGGHAMAAGLALLEKDVAIFRTAFEQVAREKLSEEQLKQTIISDGALPETAFNIETANLLQQSGPWGQNFPEPVFEGVFQILDQKILKDAHLKLNLMQVGKSVEILPSICFNVDRTVWPNPHIKTVQIIYQLSVNTFKNKRSLQLIIKNLKPI